MQQSGETVLSAGHVSRTTSVASVRKSLIGILYRLYADEGRIDLDATLADLGLDDIPPLTQQEKCASLRDLLTLRSGVYHSSAYDINRDRPARGGHPPGTYFYCNTWDFNALGTIFVHARRA